MLLKGFDIRVDMVRTNQDELLLYNEDIYLPARKCVKKLDKPDTHDRNTNRELGKLLYR